MIRPRAIPVLAAALLLGLTACSSAATPPASEPTPASEPAVAFDPQIRFAEGTETLSVRDQEGHDVTLMTATPVPEVTGVAPKIAEQFTAAVTDDFVERVDAQLQRYAALGLAECGGTPLGAAESCERPAELTLEHAGVFEEFGSVATRSAFILGSRDRNEQAHSVTMDLRTGRVAPLTAFLDLGKPADAERATTALQGAEHWDRCVQDPANESPGSYLDRVAGFFPTPDGVQLLWAPNPTETAQCQVATVLVPWADRAGAPDAPDAPDAENGEDGASSPDPAPSAESPAAPVAEDVNGSWCPTAESQDTYGCVSIALPTASYESGMTFELTLSEHIETPGTFGFIAPGAPFGTFVPAGVSLELPTYYAGADLPEQDRIWNGQTGTMLVRQ